MLLQESFYIHVKNHKVKILHYGNQPKSLRKQNISFFTYSFLLFLTNSFACQEETEWLEM